MTATRTSLFALTVAWAGLAVVLGSAAPAAQTTTRRSATAAAPTTVPSSAEAPIPTVPVTGLAAVAPGEVSVAINPTAPDHAIAVLLQRGAPGGPRITNHAYVTMDGGRTWRGRRAVSPDGRVQGDDAVTFGPDGTAFHSYISFDGIRVDRPLRASSGIYVRTSRDGLLWSTPVPVVDHVNSAIPFEDKPWIGVDRSATSPHRGSVYVAWTRFDVYGSDKPEHRSRIMLSRSRDEGRTFSVPIEISDTPGDARDGDGTVEGVVPVTGPNGEVYVAWAGPSGIVIDRSIDGGWSFGRDVVVATQPGGWDLPVPGLERHNGMPVAGVDLSSGITRGTVYVNWIDERNGDPDVFVAASRDGGATWSAPVRVNDEAPGSAQMFTWMAVDPVDGSVNVIFHDRRGQTGTRTGVTLARSVDGGRTFRTFPVAVPPFECCGPGFFGDYSGIDAYGGRVLAVFPVVADGRQQVWSAAVRFKPGTLERQ